MTQEYSFPRFTVTVSRDTVASSGSFVGVELHPDDRALAEAAPMLLEALEDCVSFLENDAAHLPCKPEIVAAQKAIAAAKGTK